MPDADDLEGEEGGEEEGAGHLDILRAEQDVAAIDAVGDDAADQREQQNGDLAEEAIETEKEGRAGEGEDQPALSDDLHPGADGGGAGANPEEAKIAVMESLKDAAPHWIQHRLRRRVLGIGCWVLANAAQTEGLLPALRRRPDEIVCDVVGVTG